MHNFIRRNSATCTVLPVTSAIPASLMLPVTSDLPVASELPVTLGLPVTSELPVTEQGVLTGAKARVCELVTFKELPEWEP